MRGVNFSEGEFYHIYNRGVDKRILFSSPREYSRFQKYLLVLNDSTPIKKDHPLRATTVEAKPRQQKCGPLVAIGAYCLMPNHFHLYVTPLTDGGVSRFMHRLQTAYTMYFNTSHTRTGALFQGTFRARYVDDDAYARYLFSYIHLNPAKLANPDWKRASARELKTITRFIGSYPYSSIGEYLRRVHTITDPSKFPVYLSDRHDVEAHIRDWLGWEPVEA
jgi:putative transposase